MKFRAEIVSGEGYREADAVMGHEVFNMGNPDIAETLSNTILKGTEKGEELAAIAAAIGSDYSMEISIAGETFNLDELMENEEKATQYFREVLDEINKIVGKEIKYCLWLCDSIEDIIVNYLLEEQVAKATFDGYEESDVVLSDIADEGKLYGYVELPECIKHANSTGEDL